MCFTATGFQEGLCLCDQLLAATVSLDVLLELAIANETGRVGQSSQVLGWGCGLGLVLPSVGMGGITARPLNREEEVALTCQSSCPRSSTVAHIRLETVTHYIFNSTSSYRQHLVNPP